MSEDRKAILGAATEKSRRALMVDHKQCAIMSLIIP